MIKAKFHVSQADGLGTKFEIDLAPSIGSDGPYLMIVYKAPNSLDGPLETLHTAVIEGYTSWAEAPLALVLRAMFLWRVTWFSTIPSNLSHGEVESLDVEVDYDLEKPNLRHQIAALSFKRKPGSADACTLVQTSPSGSYWPMELPSPTAPFAVASKVLAQVQTSHVDFHKLPAFQAPQILRDELGNRYILRDQIPFYALDTFEKFYGSSHEVQPRIESPALVPADAWDGFLTAV